jgi:hypothetical protein
MIAQSKGLGDWSIQNWLAGWLAGMSVTVPGAPTPQVPSIIEGSVGYTPDDSDSTPPQTVDYSWIWWVVGGGAAMWYVYKKFL